MANHVRQQIREALATLLTGLPTTGNHVSQSRLITLQDDELPALKIATNEETIELLDMGVNPINNRNLTITVTAVAKATNNLDDVLDTICKEVEQAVYANQSANMLGGLVKSTLLTGIEIDMNADAETPIGQAILTFNAEYFTQAATPDVSI